MNILALDQATKTTGYSVWKDGQLVAQGKFTCGELDLGQRIHQVKLNVLALLEGYKIDKLYLEDIQLENQYGVTTYKSLAELIGVLQEVAVERNLPVEIVPPATWRHGCGIMGKKREDKKANAQKHVAQKYGLQVSDDIADAICIGEYATKENDCAW